MLYINVENQRVQKKDNPRSGFDYIWKAFMFSKIPTAQLGHETTSIEAEIFKHTKRYIVLHAHPRTSLGGHPYTADKGKVLFLSESGSSNSYKYAQSQQIDRWVQDEFFKLAVGCENSQFPFASSLDCHILYTPYESSAGLEIMNENEYRYSLWGRRYERQKVFAIVLTSPSGNDYLHSEDTRQVGGSCSGWSTHKASCGSQRVGVQRRRSGSEYQIREHCSRNAVGDRKKVKEVQLGRTAVNGEQRLASDIVLGDVA
ncbi:hypothetical protein EV360DRAFT_72251 [Lentinula raphanica]|nr:hypothetical protein EV360DRAFT_72251 [Lentinula raphanica]